MSVPVQIPYNAGPIFAYAYQYTVGLADKQSGDLCSMAIQMHLRLHFYFRRLKCNKITIKTYSRTELGKGDTIVQTSVRLILEMYMFYQSFLLESLCAIRLYCP